MKKIISLIVIVSLIGCKSNNHSFENNINKDVSTIDSIENYSFVIDTTDLHIDDKYVDPGFKQQFNVKVFKGNILIDSLSIVTGKLNFFVLNDMVLYETFYSFPATGFEGFYELRNLNRQVLLASNESDQLFALQDSQDKSLWLSLFHYTESNIISKKRKPDEYYDRVGGTILLANQDSIIDIVDIYYEDSKFSEPRIMIDSSNASYNNLESLFCRYIKLNTSFQSMEFIISTKQTMIDTFNISNNRIIIDSASENNEYRFVKR